MLPDNPYFERITINNSLLKNKDYSLMVHRSLNETLFKN